MPLLASRALAGGALAMLVAGLSAPPFRAAVDPIRIGRRQPRCSARSKWCVRRRTRPSADPPKSSLTSRARRPSFAARAIAVPRPPPPRDRHRGGAAREGRARQAGDEAAGPAREDGRAFGRARPGRSRDQRSEGQHATVRRGRVAHAKNLRDLMPRAGTTSAAFIALLLLAGCRSASRGDGSPGASRSPSEAGPAASAPPWGPKNRAGAFIRRGATST